MCFAIGCGGKNVKNFVCPGLIVSLWQDVCIESVYAPRLCSLTQVRLRFTRLPVLHVQTYRWLTRAHTRAHGARATGSRKHSFFRAFTYRLSHLQTRVCAPPDGDKHSHELVNPALCWVAGSRLTASLRGRVSSHRWTPPILTMQQEGPTHLTVD